MIGLLIAWVDSRPGWDDAGITILALTLSAAIIGLFVRRRAWMYGLAVGLWIPLRGILVAHDFLLLVVLLFPMAGVHAGWALRLLAGRRPPNS
jgi:hypothetical protein